MSLCLCDLPRLGDFISLLLLVKMAGLPPVTPRHPPVPRAPHTAPLSGTPPPLDCAVGMARSRTVPTALDTSG